MTERELWNELKRHIPRDAVALRVESRTAAGIPDTMIAHNGRVFFIELKTVKTPGETIRVRGSQKTMFRRLVRNQIDVFVAIGIEGARKRKKQILFVPAIELAGENKTPVALSNLSLTVEEIFDNAKEESDE